MGKFSGIMIVSDLDGTILGKNMFSETDRKAKRYFEENGGIFTVATGRSLRSARSVLNNVYINVPSILNNGPLIQHLYTEEVFKVTYLPDETKDILKEILQEFPWLSAEIFCDDKMYLVRPNETAIWHTRNEDMDYAMESFENVPDNWIKVVLIDQAEKLVEPALILKDRPYPFRQIWSHGSIFIEFINKDSDKGASVLELARHLDIERKNIICMGDGVNDIGMIKAAGLGLAVANASEELKKVADRIIVSRDDNPLDYIVRNIL